MERKKEGKEEGKKEETRRERKREKEKGEIKRTEHIDATTRHKREKTKQNKTKSHFPLPLATPPSRDTQSARDLKLETKDQKPRS